MLNFGDRQTSLDLNGPVLSIVQQPQSANLCVSKPYTGTITPLIQTTYGGYPVRGYLYYPTSANVGSSLDVVVLYHGTITSAGVSPADAASTFMSIALNKVDIKDKIIFSVAYPQDFIPLWQANPTLPAIQFPGLDYPNLYLGDNIVYAEAALLWVKNELNSFLSSNNIPKTTNKIYTFGHSQGAYLVHRLNTLHTVDGVISNAPGPIDLLTRCSGVNQTETGSCNKIGSGIGLTSTDPDAYNSRSLKSFLSGTLSPTLFTQALDDDTADEFGTPQVANMKDIVQVGLSTCTNCASINFNYYETGGHDAFVTNVALQNDIRNFVASESGTTATFTGIATATFPTQTPANSPTNTGIITQRWYVDGYGPLTDGIIAPLGIAVVGSATTTLIVARAISPTANGLGFFMRPDYIPSAYSQPVGSAVIAGTARSTGNGNNEPYDSSVATLTVYPTITITDQPDSASVAATKPATFNVTARTSDSSSLSYQWLLNGSNLTDTSLISGSTTPSLTITSNTVGVNTVQAVISHPTSCDSPLYSDVATYAVVEPRQIINFEVITNSSSASVSQKNIFNNPVTITASNLLSFYAPERDINIEMELHGASGSSYGSNSGGRGGYAKIRFTMRQNEEYVFSGLAVNSVFLYRKSRLIASVGRGGNGGRGGRGGHGGGLSMAGERGAGRGGGSGGAAYAPGTLPSNSGVFGSASQFFPTNGADRYAPVPLGGRAIACPRGNQTVSPCADLGTRRFFWKQSTPISNTGIISRGFKQGYGIRNTPGAGYANGGNGGSGATGGNGGVNGGGGGGGGGYTDGSLIIVENVLGGSRYSTNTVIIRSIS